MDVAAARTAVKNALTSITGLNVYDFWPDKPESPAAVVGYWQNPVDVRMAFRGGRWHFELPVTIMIARQVDQDTDALLSNLLSRSSGSSVFAALEAATPSGIDGWAVMRFDPPRIVEANAVQFLACDVVCQVVTS